MVVVHPIRGVETANADFFESRGMAAYARSLEELPGKIRTLLKDEEACAAMVAAQRREIDPECARKLAACLIRLTEEKTSARGME